MDGHSVLCRKIDDTMTDWHRQALEAARRRRLSLRSVTQWVDLKACTTRTGEMDLTAVCEQVAAALEATINTDRDDTGYTLAPNMPWAPTLAVGAELPIVERLRLLELHGTRGTPTAETEFVLPVTAAETI